MNTKKVIESAFITCISVGYVSASNPMTQNLLGNSDSKQATVPTEQVSPVTSDEKVRPIEVVGIDPDSGLPIFEIEEEENSINDDYSSNEHFDEEEEFDYEKIYSLMNSSKCLNKTNEFVKLQSFKKKKKSPKKKKGK